MPRWINIGSGVVIPSDPWLLLDGRVNAPLGIPQFQTILNKYHDPALGITNNRYRWPTNFRWISTGNFVQPQWEVAGVDYHVGIDRNLFPTNASLTNPIPGGVIETALSAGGVNTYDSTNHIIFINQPNFTVQGYDFSVGGGLQVQTSTSGTNVTIKNNNFEMGANAATMAGLINSNGAGLTIINNELNGHGDTIAGNVGTGILNLNNGGTTLVQYNIVQKAYAEHMVYGSLPSTGILTVSNNVFYDCGYGAPSGAHGDIIQITAGPSTVTTFEWSWNLVLQDVVAGGSGTQGVSLQNDVTIQAWKVHNNTFLATVSSCMNQCTVVDITGAGGVQTSYSIDSNYIDSTGTNAGSPPSYFPYTNPNFSPPRTGAGNVDMVLGTTVPPTAP